MLELEADGATLTLFPDAPDWQGRAMAVAKLRFPSPQAGAAVLELAARRARDAGARALIGPMEGDTWHSYRVVTESDGRAPFLLEPTSGAHDLAALTGAGFASVGGYFSASVALTDLADNPAPAPVPGLTLSHWDGSDAEALFAEVHALSCTAFAGNAFYKPIPLAPFLAMYMPIVPMLKPDLIWFARDGSGVLRGFLFGLPNYAEGPQPQSVLLKTYASLHKGAGHLLSNAFHAAARAAGHSEALHALIHDDNLSALRSAAHGARIFRRYALMGRRLDG